MVLYSVSRPPTTRIQTKPSLVNVLRSLEIAISWISDEHRRKDDFERVFWGLFWWKILKSQWYAQQNKILILLLARWHPWCYSAGIYLLKVNRGNRRTLDKIFSRWKKQWKKKQRKNQMSSGAFIVNFEQISNI